MTKTLQKKFRIQILTFSLKILSWDQFSTLGSGQNENMQIFKFAYFQFDHFPTSEIDFESRFEMRMSNVQWTLSISPY